MNQDEIIEAEVEKAERRCFNYYTSYVDVYSDPNLAWQDALAEFRMDLKEIAELYGFDPRTGEYVINAGGWCAPIHARGWTVPQLEELRDHIWTSRIDDPRFHPPYEPTSSGDCLYRGTPIEELS
ncbi:MULTISPECIES: hypothetical protein [Nocardiaceae]|uniref:hypothetical protein n=1 Tax=Nocardiaceae TaxID=85025 RepID=UPI000A72C1FA|nr:MULTISPECIES: hypothetical protein [Rhodococcus]